MPETRPSSRDAVILGPGEGRSYPMGRIAAVFKADEVESESRYSISEWWLEPHTQGPGAHSHPEDHVQWCYVENLPLRGSCIWSLVASPDAETISRFNELLHEN